MFVLGLFCCHKNKKRPKVLIFVGWGERDLGMGLPVAKLGGLSYVAIRF